MSDITYSSMRSGVKKKKGTVKEVHKDMPFIEGLSNMEIYDELDAKKKELEKLKEQGL